MEGISLNSSSVARFLERLNALDSHLFRYSNAGHDTRATREDADDLLEELLLIAQSAIDFKDLERRFLAGRTLDFESLWKLHKILMAVPLPKEVRLSPEVVLDVPDLLEGLRASIEDLEKNVERKSTLEIRIGVDMRVATPVRRLLTAAAVSGQSIPELKALVTDKLSLLEGTQLNILWSSVQAELGWPFWKQMSEIGGTPAEEWRRFDDSGSVRRKYAEYVVELKYRLMFDTQKQGQTAFPLNSYEVATIASWRYRSSSERIDSREASLQKSIARLRETGETLFSRSSDDFALALRLDPASPLLRVERRLLEEKNDHDETFPEFLYEMRKAAHLIDSFIARDSAVEHALRQFKLGLEVLGLDARVDVETKPELRLQRDLAKFLIERGIYAVGTKFGRSETDLVSNERSDLYIVEVKKFLEGATPGSIYATVGQLQGYMDQHPEHPLGVLVIFNLGDTFIVAPRQWIRGKYWVVAINLPAASPSQFRRSLSIEEGTDGATVSVHWLPSVSKE